jgi:hypothetical protein
MDPLGVFCEARARPCLESFLVQPTTVPDADNLSAISMSNSLNAMYRSSSLGPIGGQIFLTQSGVRPVVQPDRRLAVPDPDTGPLKQVDMTLRREPHRCRQILLTQSGVRRIVQPDGRLALPDPDTGPLQQEADSTLRREPHRCRQIFLTQSGARRDCSLIAAWHFLIRYRSAPKEADSTLRREPHRCRQVFLTQSQ